MRRIFSLSLFFFLILSLSAQLTSRSGFPAPPESHDALRLFPCGGIGLFQEKFSADTLPPMWAVHDVDGQAVNSAIDTLYAPGWTPIRDFKDPNNRAIASTAWYNDESVPSDDWLISPKVQVGSNTCLSWVAYSQDRFFAESYEVWVTAGQATPDSMGFLGEPGPVLTVSAEGFFLSYRSVNLATVLDSIYANKEVSIAFRHTSLNKFMLVLDDVRLAEIESKDIGAFSVQDFDLSPGDSTFFEASVRNFGADTIVLDSSLRITYAVTGGSPVTSKILDDTTVFVLAPNDTMQFVHPIDWNSPNQNDVYYICLWTNWPGDQDHSNDTACLRVGVGVDITSIEDLGQLPISIFPNPTNGFLHIHWEESHSPAKLELLNPLGARVRSTVVLAAGKQAYELNISELASGIYFLRITDEEGRSFFQKVVKE